MSGYWPKSEKVTSKINPTISSGPSTDFGENFAAAREDMRLNNNGSSQYIQFGQAYADRAQDVYERTGKKLENPITKIPLLPGDEIKPGLMEQTRARYIEEFEAEVDKLRAEHPDLPDHAQMIERIKERSSDIEFTAADTSDRARFSGKVGSLAGSLIGAVEDPLIGSTLVLGATKSLSILKTAIIEGLIGAGSETVVQPQVQSGRDERGLESGFKQGALNVATAGGGGFVLGGSGKAIEQLVGRKLLKRFDSSVKNPTREQQTARDLYERVTDINESSPLDSSVPEAVIEHNDRLAQALKSLEEDAVPADLPDPSAPLSVEKLTAGQDNLDGIIWSFNPGDIQTDAKTFQFKEGGDASGVTERLRGVTEWDPVKAGQVIVFEDAAGKRFIADGHQRLGLAQRLAENQKVTLYGQLFREDDGFSPEMVRVIAAMKNVAEGTGTAIDAAKVLRVSPDRIRELPPQSALVRQAADMVNLSDEAFGMVVNEIVPANYASVVGRLLSDQPDFQMAVLDVLAKTEPANVTQAEAIIRQAMAAGRKTETQIGLFGEETITSSLFLERAKVLDKALKKLRQDAKVFDTLLRNEERIASEGNVLARSANEQRAQTDARAAQMIQTLANRKGSLSDALTNAARRAADEKRFTGATDDFVEAVRSAIERGDFDGLPSGGAGRGDEIAGQAQARVSEPAESPLDEQSLKLFDDPAGTGAELQARGLEADLRRDAGIDQTDIGAQRVIPGAEKIRDKELAERGAQGKLKSKAQQKPADEGLFDDVGRAQQDLLDAAVPVAERVDPETGRVISETRTIRQILDDLDQADADLDAIGKCGSP